MNKMFLLFIFVLSACVSGNKIPKNIKNKFTYSNKYIKLSKGTSGESVEVKYKDNYGGTYSSKFAKRAPSKQTLSSKIYEDNGTYKKKKNYKGHYKIGNPYTIMGQTYYPKEEPDYEEIGMASWYGAEFDGKKTANGEIYDMHDYTAAHRTLPLPSVVKVTNLENGKSAIVRVNDRGPFVKNRIIDVSKNVAKKLDFHEKGTTRVKVVFLQKETNKMLKEFGLK